MIMAAFWASIRSVNNGALTKDLKKFSPQLDGVGYVFDAVNLSDMVTTSANKYEVSKFGRAETFVPQSVKRVVLAAQRRSCFWPRGEKAMRTCSDRRLTATALLAIMRGQKLGAV